MHTVSRRFLLWFFALFATAVILIGTFYFDNSRIILKNQYIESFDGSISQLDNSISEFISNFESALDMFSENEMIQNIEKDPEKYYLPSRDLFKSFQESYPSTAFAYFAPSKTTEGSKKLVTWPDTSTELEYANWQAIERPWYINAVKADGRTAWTKPYLDATTQKPIITISKTVKNQNDEIAGVIAIDFFLDELSNKIENFKAFKQGHAFLVDKSEDGYVFITKDVNFQKLDNIVSSDWMDKIYEKNSGSFYVREDYKSYYITFTTNKLTGWKALGLIEETKIYEKSKMMMQEVFTSGLIIIFIGIICIMYISKQMTRSVNDLNSLLNREELSPATDEENLSDKFSLLMSEPDDSFMDEPGSYIGLLFESESELERLEKLIQNNLDSKDAAHYAVDFESCVDKLVYFRNKLDDISSKPQQIQKESIDNHLKLAYSKIKAVSIHHGDAFYDVQSKIEKLFY